MWRNQKNFSNGRLSMITTRRKLNIRILLYVILYHLYISLHTMKHNKIELMLKMRTKIEMYFQQLSLIARLTKKDRLPWCFSTDLLFCRLLEWRDVFFMHLHSCIWASWDSSDLWKSIRVKHFDSFSSPLASTFRERRNSVFRVSL